jgi:SnoaL-like domain
MNDVAERYLACWNETDSQARRKLIDEAWTESATYSDPLAEVSGRQAISELISMAQAQFPGMVFTRAGDVDAHHSQARFRWSLGPQGAESLVDGFDVIVVDAEGKIATVLGFLDKVPAA